MASLTMTTLGEISKACRKKGFSSLPARRAWVDFLYNSTLFGSEMEGAVG
jgi:hypothetical protein